MSSKVIPRLRRDISRRVASESPRYERAINKKHIFASLIEELTANQGPEIRLPLLHEFAMINNLVVCAKANRLSECGSWHREILDARDRRGCVPEELRALDCCLLPALALADFKCGNVSRAVSNLEESIRILEDYFRSGVEPAGVAALEQRLNVMRASAADHGRFAENVVEFILVVMNRTLTCEDGEARLQRGSGADAKLALNYLSDEAIFKLFGTLSGDLLRSVVVRIASLDSEHVDATAFLYGMKILSALLQGDGSSTFLAAPDTELLLECPPAVLIGIEVATSGGSRSAAANDEFFLWVSQHPGYSRFRQTLERTLLN